MKHDDATRLVILREENQRFYLHFIDVDTLSQIYCDFKKKNGARSQSWDLKGVRDHFMSYMKGLEKKGLVEVGSGINFGKSFLQYEIERGELLDTIQKNFAVKRNPNKVI